MKKYGSKNGSARAKQKITTKMLIMPRWAYCVQILTISLESAVDAVAASRRRCRLM